MGLNYKDLWDLPNLPHTELIGTFDKDLTGMDQRLVLDEVTVQVRLKNVIPPKKIYSTSSYIYRSSKSFKNKKQQESFLNFAMRLVNDSCKTLVDLGGNDLFLSESLKDSFES